MKKKDNYFPPFRNTEIKDLIKCFKKDFLDCFNVKFQVCMMSFLMVTMHLLRCRSYYVLLYMIA